MFQVLNFHTKCLLDNYSDISMTLFDIFFMFFCVWRLSTFVWIVEYKWYYNYSKNYEKTKNLLKQPFLCLNNLKPVQIYNEKSFFCMLRTDTSSNWASLENHKAAPHPE